MPPGVFGDYVSTKAALGGGRSVSSAEGRGRLEAGGCAMVCALFGLRGSWCGVGVRFVVCRPFGAAS